MKNFSQTISVSLVIVVIILLTIFAGSDQKQTAATSGDAATASDLPPTSPLTTEQAQSAYGKLPLVFEANRGQTDKAVNFLARGAGYSLFLKPTEAVFLMSRQSKQPEKKDIGHVTEKGAIRRAAKSAVSHQSAVLRMKLVGANASAAVEGLDETAGKVNYFVGSDKSKWQANVPTFARVNYREVYPGIDMTYYGNQRQLEYDFVVAPGADSRQIALTFGGAKKVEVEAASGDLIVTTSDGGEVRQHKPVVYQEVAGERRIVEGSYVKVGKKGEIGFQIGEYDQTLPLIIDPTLVYSTYLGGSNFDSGSSIAVDSQGNAYVTGFTRSTNFPTKNPLQATFGGGGDAFVTKLNATGDGLVYSTYLGGNSFDQGSSIAVDSSGNAYVTGGTASTNFPTKNPLQATFGGNFDAFVTKLNATGDALVYSTFFGASDGNGGSGIAVDNQGNAYVTGDARSTNFPTKNPFQATKGGGESDAFVAKISDGAATTHTAFDFDGDGRSDISVFRPSDGVWYLNRSGSGFTAAQFGLSTDKITPADFDGDGKTDIAVYRDGIWYWLNSSNGNFNAYQFGVAGDVPVPADYMGDGRAELAVFRPSDRVWYIFNLANNQFSATQFGISTDKPVPADFDGDGKTDIAVYRPSDGVWQINTASQSSRFVQFGISTDKTVVGDYDGDGKADIAVYRPENGYWYYLRSSDGGFRSFQFGISTDTPVPADYDGDGTTDIAVYRAGVWYILRSLNSQIQYAYFGFATDVPIPSVFNR